MGQAAYSVATVILSNGQQRSLAGLDENALHCLQWEEEQAFASAILSAPPVSQERQATIAAAYNFLGIVMSARAQKAGKDVERVDLGSQEEYANLVVTLLQQQKQGDFAEPYLFEVGYGSGILIAEIERRGFAIGGIEISSILHDQAVRFVNPQSASNLLVGNVLDLEITDLCRRPSMIYWNDVMEHIAPDEVLLYLKRLHDLLAPGGTLVTITPNWLRRPSDITADFNPPRTQSRGLHLKEYRLAEVVRLLKMAGFNRISGPLCAVRGRLIVSRFSALTLKTAVEPILNRLPLKIMRTWTTRLALAYSIAHKAK